jgi:hypothetical protein
VGKETFNNEGLVEQEFYDDYYEGLYFLDKETFWSMMDSDLDDTEDITEDEFIEKYPYLDEADQKQLRKDFKEYKTAD